MKRIVPACSLLCLALFGFSIAEERTPGQPATTSANVKQKTELDRSPTDLILTPDQTQIITANRTSGTLSLIDVESRKILDEHPVGQEPIALAISADGKKIFVSNHRSGTVQVVVLANNKLTPQAEIQVGAQPHGLALSADEKKLYVALTAEDCIAVLDLATGKVITKWETGRWPRFLALSAEGTRLAVGTSGDRGVTLLDATTGEIITIQRFVGLNIGQMQISRDNHVYFPWMVYRRNPISSSNIKRGWVLASRIARLHVDGSSRREALSLDPAGKAVADPHGLALTPDEQFLAVTAGGTQELLLFRLQDLPLASNGSSDHIPPELLNDADRFTRIPLGGRPLNLRIAADNRTAYVVNYLLNAVQVVDLQDRKLTHTIPLGGPESPSAARRGEAIFYDGRRSLDQWYSCHSCHYEGGTNSVTMDTHNDGSVFSFKTILSLYHLKETAPWTWHGWQEDLDAAMEKSLTSTLMGKSPTESDVADLLAYFAELKPPVNDTQILNSSDIDQVAKGKALFNSEVTGCANCHTGKYFTDGQVHDVGLGSSGDRYRGFNTPTLLGAGQKVLYLHDGRSKSLQDLLTGPHNPEKVSGTAPLSEKDVSALIAYLKTL